MDGKTRQKMEIRNYVHKLQAVDLESNQASQLFPTVCRLELVQVHQVLSLFQKQKDPLFLCEQFCLLIAHKGHLLKYPQPVPAIVLFQLLRIPPSRKEGKLSIHYTQVDKFKNPMHAVKLMKPTAKCKRHIHQKKVQTAQVSELNDQWRMARNMKILKNKQFLQLKVDMTQTLMFVLDITTKGLLKQHTAQCIRILNTLFLSRPLK